uniref:Uncharacterized protein n=1 Tax=Spermophilus dauricus TaxID=99837 RepID=A0A8C9QCH5_SPEDA
CHCLRNNSTYSPDNPCSTTRLREGSTEKNNKNVGRCVLCLGHDEHYILTFPNGCGRSILTVPWMELRGECNINCSKTSYSANIIFHTKPFYGSKKHRIIARFFLSK